MSDQKTATTEIVQNEGFGTVIWNGLKQNWWKILIGAATTGTAFLAGMALGGDFDQEEPPFDEKEPEA